MLYSQLLILMIRNIYLCDKCDINQTCVKTRSMTKAQEAVIPAMYPLQGDHKLQEQSQQGMISIPRNEAPVRTEVKVRQPIQQERVIQQQIFQQKRQQVPTQTLYHPRIQTQPICNSS